MILKFNVYFYLQCQVKLRTSLITTKLHLTVPSKFNKLLFLKVYLYKKETFTWPIK